MSKRKKKPAARPRRARRRPPASSRRRSFLGAGTEASLRDKITGFVYQPRLDKDFDRALKLYFGKAARRRTLVADEEELPSFQEWLIYDFVTRSGRRLIDQFADEVGPELPEAEARLLAAWREMNRLRLFEVQSVHPGDGVVVRDLLGDETLTINDLSASHTLRRWMVFLARPHQAEDRVCFTGTSPALTPRQKKEMLQEAQKLWDAYRAQRPEAPLSDFYRDHSLGLLRAMQRLQEEAQRPPTVLTAEGHDIVIARAKYTVRDSNAVADLLSDAEEFNYAGPSEEHHNALHFNWLLRGRSDVPENPTPTEGALMLRTDVTAGPGEPAFRSLGDITLWKKRLELECMSRERLKAGKALLAEMLGGLVKHRRDRFEAFEMEAAQAPARDTATQRRAPRRRLSREELAIEREMHEQHTREWLDAPIPSLNNLSPREAVNTPEGRAEIIEMLKYVEYLEDDRRASGEPPAMDIARIRRELGLPPE